ncbi:MAG: NAD-dependent epimerase/dehydratase family protein [Candidatus Heimdallarchaeaceae archaeon]
MNVFVTGGEGFIGSEVCDKLCHLGYNAISLDRRSRDNLRKPNPDVERYRINICNYPKLKKVLIKADGIIHLAAVSRVVWGEYFPKDCLDINILGTWNIINIARQSEKNPWIIFGSSREVYGETDGKPVAEDFVLNPINTYGISKLAAERLIKQYSLQNDSRSIVLRFSNVYGTLSDILDRVTPKFIMNALLDKPLRIHGGEQVMDFTFVEDTVNGIIKAVNHINTIEQKKYFEHFHLLPGEPHTLYDLIDYIKLSVSGNLQIIHENKREYDVEKFVGNPLKAKEVLGFKCKTSFKEGVRKTVNTFKKGLRENRDRVIKKFEEDKKCELL